MTLPLAYGAVSAIHKNTASQAGGVELFRHLYRNVIKEVVK
jgi:hypothetical protein